MSASTPLGFNVIEITRNIPCGTTRVTGEGYIIQAEKTSVHDFKNMSKLFFANKPEFELISKDARSKNFVVAGGNLVCNMLGLPSKDIDIFIVEPRYFNARSDSDIAYMKKKIQNFCDLVVEQCGLIDDPKAVSITSKVITLRTKTCGEVQIILRPVRNVSQLLDQFDIQCAALGFILYENRSVIHKDAITAWQTMTNVYNAARCSPTYCARFEKYFKRGFSMFIEQADINKVVYDWKAEKYIQMPAVTIRFDSITENPNMFDQMMLVGPVFEHKVTSFYDNEASIIATNFNYMFQGGQHRMGVAFNNTQENIFENKHAPIPEEVLAAVKSMLINAVTKYDFSAITKVFGFKYDDEKAETLRKNLCALAIGRVRISGEYVKTDDVKFNYHTVEALISKTYKFEQKVSTIFIDWIGTATDHGKAPLSDKYYRVNLDYSYHKRHWLTDLVSKVIKPTN
tara:strand:+ start:4760 stop:6127 length:1368 start_codon:yes stop_codon:yes gene_type:complete